MYANWPLFYEHLSNGGNTVGNSARCLEKVWNITTEGRGFFLLKSNSTKSSFQNTGVEQKRPKKINFLFPECGMVEKVG